MTTPIENIPLPYTLSLYPGTNYWWHIHTDHRNAGNNYQHQLPKGEYQVMFTTAAAGGAEVRIRQGNNGHVLRLLESGEPAISRSGAAIITITEPTGTLEFPAITLSQGDVAAATSAVVTIFPFTSYTP